MRVDAFDFDLPEELIALRPARPRDASRLLVVRPPGGLADAAFAELPQLLAPGDALVFNDTRVIPAELHGTRRRGAAAAGVRLTLIERRAADTWLALARPAKRLAPGDVVEFDDGVSARVMERGGEGEATVAFDRAGADLDAAIAAIGHVPLPPYIAGRRAGDRRDRDDYQTIYARHDGAVAAPTAGLHFTDAVMAALEARGVASHRLTLHVGAGTFLPVKADDTSGHRMHAERGHMSATTAEALNAVRANGGRIVAVGTTSLRLLESAVADDGTLAAFDGETSIFLTPGDRFRAVDVLLTNFHLPRSTLFMLVSAFSGIETMRRAYAHAIAAGYRFYSYGDACLLFPEAA